MIRNLLCLAKRGCAALALALCAGAAQAAPLDTGDMRAAIARARDEPVDTLMQSAEHAHPIAMWLLARRLYDLDRRDEAAFWFYVGQLRWRSCLMQNPNCGREPYSRLFETIGPDINTYAYRDLPRFYAMVDSVLAWDASHPDDYVTDADVKERVRQGLRELVDYTRAHADQLRARQEELDREDAARGGDPFGGAGGALMGMPQELLTAYDAQRFSGFRRGVTTRADVLSALGRPEWWETDAHGASTFGYSYLRATDISAALGMSERVQVTIQFDTAKVVTGLRLPRD